MATDVLYDTQNLKITASIRAFFKAIYEHFQIRKRRAFQEAVQEAVHFARQTLTALPKRYGYGQC